MWFHDQSLPSSLFHFPGGMAGKKNYLLTFKSSNLQDQGQPQGFYLPLNLCRIRCWRKRQFALDWLGRIHGHMKFLGPVHLKSGVIFIKSVPVQYQLLFNLVSRSHFTCWYVGAAAYGKVTSESPHAAKWLFPKPAATLALGMLIVPEITIPLDGDLMPSMWDLTIWIPKMSVYTLVGGKAANTSKCSFSSQMSFSSSANDFLPSSGP